jgi:hypothetical protein
MRFGRPVVGSYPHRRQATPAEGSSYLRQAEACLAEAAAAPSAASRALHQEECALWLMLAGQRKAIEKVMQAYVREVAETLA